MVVRARLVLELRYRFTWRAFTAALALSISASMAGLTVNVPSGEHFMQLGRSSRSSSGGVVGSCVCMRLA